MIEILDPVTDSGRIEQLLAVGSGVRYVDGWETARDELTAIDALAGVASRWRADAAVAAASRYVYYPWRSTLVRLPDSREFWRLRTARNRYLLDESEQEAWSDALIGVAGLSVGSSALSVCALTGARRFRIADPDVLGPTNLNRLVGSVCDLGVPKTVIASRRVLEADPYTDLEVFPSGYDDSAADMFVGSDAVEPLAVLIEEMDDFAMKVAIRLRARAVRVPVVMATDNGDNVILDVERFDLEPARELFHGRAGTLDGLGAESLNAPADRVRLAKAIVGSRVTPRTRYSLTEVGRSLPSWPQLGTAATAAGAVAALAARLIVTGIELPSGRYRFDLDRVLLGERAELASRWNELDEETFLGMIG